MFNSSGNSFCLEFCVTWYLSVFKT